MHSQGKMISILRDLVEAAISKPDVLLGDLSQFQIIICRLRDNAPDVATAIFGILQGRNDNRDERKRKPTADPSYRPHKSARRGAGDGPNGEGRRKQKPRRTRTAARGGSDEPAISDKPEQSAQPEPQEITQTNETPSREQPVGSTPPSSLAPVTQTQEQHVTPQNTAIPIDMAITLTEAIDILQRLSRCPSGTPKAVHVQILRSLKEGPMEKKASSSGQWSDGSTWVQILECGMSQNKKNTIFNLLELIGAAEWFDQEIEIAQPTTRTKKNGPTTRRGTTIYVMNQMENKLRQLRTDDRSEVTEFDKLGILQKKNLTMYFARGRKLRHIVAELGLGILFSHRIWSYIKMSKDALASDLRLIQGNTVQMGIIQILGPHLECLVNTGSISLGSFYNDLWEKELISDKDLHKLRAYFGPNDAPLPPGELDTAINHLRECIAQRAFGKQHLHDKDTVKIYNLELSNDVFDQLRSGMFDMWTIAAAMLISDKPATIRCYESVALDENGKEKSSPFNKLVGKIDENRRQTDAATKLVHFFPILNAKNQHFTLLEINDEEHMIRHYDSAADKAIIRGMSKITRVCSLVMNGFGHLQYQYNEEPTPQQDDNWSCGVRVAWNFKHLANGLAVGSWDVRLNPDRMKMEIVEGLLRCAEAGMMRGNRCGDRLLRSRT